jgi:hypothetical protein
VIPLASALVNKSCKSGTLQVHGNGLARVGRGAVLPRAAVMAIRRLVQPAACGENGGRARGIYQGWDLHPALLASRHAAVASALLESLPAALNRLAAHPGRSHERVRG